MNDNIIYTVTQLNNFSSSILKKKLSNIWVKGEVSSLKKYPSGFAYFTLKDQKAQISCIISVSKCTNIFDGTQVTVNGDVGLYTLKGAYQISVHTIFPSGTGELWVKYLALKEKLTNKGYFDANKKKPLPLYPNKIGVITSKNGAVIRDIQNILMRRAPYIKIILRNTKINGFESASDIINALDDFFDYNDVDLIIIARGGGDFEDLMGFNDQGLVEKIYSSTIPIVSAIGHESDYTLCDFVSDIRASTPSEAAEIICQNKIELESQLNNLYTNLHMLIMHRFETNKNLLLKYITYLNNNNITSNVFAKVEKVGFSYKLLMNIMLNKIEQYKIKINLYKKILSSINLNKIKNKGFSIIKKDGVIIKTINDLKVNDLINIEINNGIIISEIKELYDKKK